MKRLFLYGVSVVLLGCALPSLDPQLKLSHWHEIDRPTGDLSILSINTEYYPGRQAGRTQDGHKVYFEPSRLLKHPAFGGAAIFDGGNDWYLAWDESRTAWVWWWLDTSQMNKRSYDIVFQDFLPELRRRAAVGREVLREPPTEAGETKFPLGLGIRPTPQLGPLRSRRDGTPLPAPSVGRIDWYLPLDEWGGWLEVQGVQELGSSGDGNHPVVHDNTVIYCKVIPGARGWIRWKSFGPVDGSMRVLIY